jgi:Ca2+-binding RTX toxin-like protein
VADAGEGVIAGATVGLDSTGDGAADSTTQSGSDGSYSFTGLTARSYRVLFTVPSGYEQAGFVSHDKTLAVGEAATGFDFFARVIAPSPTPTPTPTPTPAPEPAPDNLPLEVDLLGGKADNGANALSGTAGADKLFGLGGDDLLLGFAGNDLLDGGPGNDTLDGGSGNDRLFGRAGRDKLRGGTGNDSLDGGSGADQYNGGAGNDVIKSRDGVAETVKCGSGRDTVKADMKDRLSGCENVKRR